MWYSSPNNQGWGGATKSLGRKSSIIEADNAPGGNPVKASAGRVIRIINNMDHSVQVSSIFSFYFNPFFFVSVLHLDILNRILMNGR